MAFYPFICCQSHPLTDSHGVGVSEQFYLLAACGGHKIFVLKCWKDDSTNGSEVILAFQDQNVSSPISCPFKCDLVWIGKWILLFLYLDLESGRTTNRCCRLHWKNSSLRSFERWTLYCKYFKIYHHRLQTKLYTYPFQFRLWSAMVILFMN